MQYQGGKYLISSQIAKIIGGGRSSIEIPRWKVENSKRISDRHEGGAEE